MHRWWDIIKTKLESKMRVREIFFFFKNNSAHGHMAGCCEHVDQQNERKLLTL